MRFRRSPRTPFHGGASDVDLEPNPEWGSADPPFMDPFDSLPGFEPWEPADDEERGDRPLGIDLPSGCHYCGAKVDRIDPFGGKPCCYKCFNDLIGGERDDPPWVCGNEVVVP